MKEFNSLHTYRHRVSDLNDYASYQVAQCRPKTLLPDQ